MAGRKHPLQRQPQSKPRKRTRTAKTSGGYRLVKTRIPTKPRRRR
jgi:hypothetical protein